MLEVWTGSTRSPSARQPPLTVHVRARARWSTCWPWSETAQTATTLPTLKPTCNMLC